MASSPYPSVSSTSYGSFAPKQYDVFLSFRGEDTRNNFTSHLHAALARWNIKTYMDNNLARGDEISEKLHKAIQGSKVAVVIFSKNYATSSWCLDELVKIIECKETKGQILLPIFYHIEPSDIRYQKGSYAKAFAKHERYFGHNKEKLDGWRDALTKAANLRGLHTSEYRKEAELVEKIAEDVFLILQSEQLAIDEVTLQGEKLRKRSLGKTMRFIKEHANASLKWNFRKGRAPSVDGNVEYHL